MKIVRFASSAALLLASALVAPASAQDSGQPKSFPVAKAVFEQNATDGDVEVVFEVTGRREGLTALSIEAPDGHSVVDFSSNKTGNSAASGIRQFVFESPEPKDVAGLRAAFPVGVYKFEGKTESGAVLRGEATLSHTLPATAAITFPQSEARDVTFDSPTIAWEKVPAISGYIVELEQEDLDVSIKTKLPATETTFAVPKGFLKPGTEYKIGVGTVSKEGNISFVETSFTTKAAK